jgi:drug/metabolite transporter (DMT)-like permease
MIFLVPALADSISTTLQYMGLNFISVSTFMMLKGSSIVSTAIFSRILIKMKLQRWHLVGCGLAIVGVMIVGASSIVGNQENSEKKDSNDVSLEIN